MDNEQSKQICDEIESALPEILPDLGQLLQQYQLSEPLEIQLLNLNLSQQQTSIGPCCLVGTVIQCFPTYRPRVAEDTLGLKPEQAEQLCIDVESKLAAILPRLSQSVQQTDEMFEVHFLIDPANTTAGQSATCKVVDGVIRCSNS